MGPISEDHLVVNVNDNDNHKVDLKDCGSSGDSGVITDNMELQQRERMDSGSSSGSDFSGLENLEPLELDDLRRFKRQESMSEGDDDVGNLPGVAGAKFFSVAMSLKRKVSGLPPLDPNKKRNVRAVKNWKNALKLIKTRADPWEKFHLDELPVENAVRHRYNALMKTWCEDECVVKIDMDPFNHGAMRECFRMKKLSNFCADGKNWESDCNNYVAKRYMDPSVERQTYFEDVKLQNDAKLWGEEYNRHNPPKKVDIFQMAIIEFVDRPGKPLFHIEHYIEGDYVKYNSNSGFVDSKYCRQTPHAFSHFTFERSGHEIIVVDVQGVGDLYTDPQIHTAYGEDYGDGNLGTKGMALFFHSHHCNSICQRLKLTPFDLAPQEISDMSGSISAASSCTGTVLRGNEVIVGSPHSSHSETKFPKFFRRSSFCNESNSASARLRHHSDYFSAEDISPPNSASIIEADDEQLVAADDDDDDEDDESQNSVFPLQDPPAAAPKRRVRYISECSEDSGIRTKELHNFQGALKRKSRPSCINADIINMDDSGSNNSDSILGQVHLDLAKYHEVCRFVTEDTGGNYDHVTALFHLKAAADCGVLSAILSFYRLHFDLPHDILTNAWASDLPYGQEDQQNQVGIDYAHKAANLGDRSSMVFIARAHDYGSFGLEKSLDSAVHWYTKIQKRDEDTEDETEWGMDDPPYAILARLAEIWREGFTGANKDPNKAGELYTSAAESAMACMKGKLANKYYMLAEEAWGEVEEE